MTNPQHTLRPCPFCKGSRLRLGGDDKFVGVCCLDCDAVGPNHYQTGYDWSIRASDATIVRQRELIEKMRVALQGMVNHFKPFTLKPIGAPYSQARMDQDAQLAAHEEARALIEQAEKEL